MEGEGALLYCRRGGGLCAGGWGYDMVRKKKRTIHSPTILVAIQRMQGGATDDQLGAHAANGRSLTQSRGPSQWRIKSKCKGKGTLEVRSR